GRRAFGVQADTVLGPEPMLPGLRLDGPRRGPCVASIVALESSLVATDRIRDSGGDFGHLGTRRFPFARSVEVSPSPVPYPFLHDARDSRFSARHARTGSVCWVWARNGPVRARVSCTIAWFRKPRSAVAPQSRRRCRH